MSSSKNLEYEKTSFLSKSNSAFIEQMYLKFINKESDLPESWEKYFEGMGEELDVIAKEINGPSWSIAKKRVDIDEIQKRIEKNDTTLSSKENVLEINQKDFIKLNSATVNSTISFFQEQSCFKSSSSRFPFFKFLKSVFSCVVGAFLF